MIKTVAINGSPRKGKGHTATVLASFIEGLTESGADVELFYASKLKVKPCGCGEMQCWYKHQGKCCIDDDMKVLYPKLKEADFLVIATPVYIPLPGDMQNLINRLCPLVEPHLEFRNRRTRARFREGVNIKSIVLVSTGGWWEKENMNTVVRIVEELAEDVGVEFGGAVLRPHAFLMEREGQITKEGKEILGAVKKAGRELIQNKRMKKETLEFISRPLITEEELRQKYNQLL